MIMHGINTVKIWNLLDMCDEAITR